MSFPGEMGTLLVLFAAAAALVGFAAIADEVLEGETHGFDEALLLAFRNPADHADPIGPAWLEIAMRDITALGSTSVLMLVTLIAIGFLLMAGKRGAALLVTLSIAGGTALSLALKSGFDRPRPDLVAHLVDVHTLSFPSGHAMLTAVTFLTLGALLARTQRSRRLRAYIVGIALFLTLLVGSSRVYLGVHWPTDVLAGWCVGSAWALICWMLALWLQRRGEIEPETGTADNEGPTALPPDEATDARTRTSAK
ncbi:phosphatase PAP2 family protein [Ancylobacter lacus]|uniref:phosphatase PAP2 family protein n=1 Tax=Ancylobacter lacus TaxID=2579970 RepID=UPI001BCDBBB0|nr:phosphatase PAP2 family protein [Ancylobacter lacus]MBS7537450.1 phosphatase PAP2 family protein [Ancylobacter lacus]